VKQCLNAQIILEQVILELVEYLEQASRYLASKVAESKTKVPQFLDSQVFPHLIGKVTIVRINKHKIE